MGNEALPLERDRNKPLAMIVLLSTLAQDGGEVASLMRSNYLLLALIGTGLVYDKTGPGMTSYKA